MMLNTNANVTIIVSGLAICHYNSGTGNWEFLLPRQIYDHNLKIIFKKYFKNGNEVKHEILVDESVAKISVETVNVFEPSSDTEFNYVGGADKAELDARWILDIAELYGKSVKLRNINGKKYTYLSIPAGTLYAESFPTNPYVQINNPNSTSKRTRVAQSAAIDIQWQAGTGSTTIKNSADNNELITGVLRDPNVALYKIEFNNDCPQNCAGQETDYKHYNEDLIDLNDKFTIDSVYNNNSPVPIMGEVFLQMLSNTLSPPFCADAPCFLGECSMLDGITSLEELL